MFYGRKKVEELVSRMIWTPPEREAVLELIYALVYPELPPTLAEVILANPQIVLEGGAFPANLAFGLVDTGLEFREESKRNERYRSYFRQVNALGYELEQREFPSAFVNTTASRFWLLATGAQAAKDLSTEETLPGSLRATFTEQLILALSGCRELMLLLLQHLSASWSEGKKTYTIRVIGRTTEEALHNQPLLQGQLVHDIGGDARFHEIHLENQAFRQEAERVTDSLAAGFRSSARPVSSTVLAPATPSNVLH